jgi:hypothetical protein
MSKRIVFSGRVKPSTKNKDGSISHNLWAWVYNDASIQVAAGVGFERCEPNEAERVDALEAAVKAMSWKLLMQVREELRSGKH